MQQTGSTTLATATAPLHSPWRLGAAAGAFVAAIAHIPVISEHLEEAPYMGVLFVLLTIACVILSVALLIRDAPAIYLAAAAICTTAVLGYCATRLVPFPQLADDVGTWLEPLGVIAVASEALVVASTWLALARYQTARRSSLA